MGRSPSCRRSREAPQSRPPAEATRTSEAPPRSSRSTPAATGASWRAKARPERPPRRRRRRRPSPPDSESRMTLATPQGAEEAVPAAEEEEEEEEAAAEAAAEAV